MATKICSILGVSLIAWTGSIVLAQAPAPPPPPPTPTLWNFLGIPQALNKIHANSFNRKGNHPALEKKPPLLKIADPANLASDVPAIKAAAEIKQAEDLKPQKIKAIKYLAKIGCGCYDKDEKVTKALVAAMGDCTEDVRLEAVRAISLAAASEECVNCKQKSCCNEKIAEQLYKLAYELDDLGCPIEPSERVREAAIAAMQICCPGYAPASEAAVEEAIERVEQPGPVEGTPPVAPPPPPVLDSARKLPSARETAPRESLATSLLRSVIRESSHARSLPAPTPTATASTQRTSPEIPAARSQPEVREPAQSLVVTGPQSSRRTAQVKSVSYGDLPPARPVLDRRGVVAIVDAKRNLAHIHFPHDGQLAPVGSRLHVYNSSASGEQFAGEVEVIESANGSATVRGHAGLKLASLGRGATVK